MKANIVNKLDQLRNTAQHLEILTDQSDAKFQKHAERWSDVDRKIPAAILLPNSEEQIQKAVRMLS
jgi:FAD/FMN-containing dehydrogenase